MWQELINENIQRMNEPISKRLDFHVQTIFTNSISTFDKIIFYIKFAHLQTDEYHRIIRSKSNDDYFDFCPLSIALCIAMTVSPNRY